MTGAPVETWRKFRFSTAPAWAAVFLLLLCTGFGLLLVFLAMYLVSRRASGYLPLTRASSHRVALASWIPAGLIVGSFLLGFVALIAYGANSSSSAPVGKGLVYTKWVADPNVTSGMEVGYKPALTGLSGDDVASVTAAIDPGGTGWLVNITFSLRGANLFANLTRDNVAACPGDVATDTKAQCVGRYLTMWLGLTQADIDRWEDASYAANVARPFGSGGKFLLNAITIQEIDGGAAQINGSLNQKQAQDLVAAIKPVSTTSSPVGSAIVGWLGGLALLMFIVGIVGGLVVRRFIGPQGKVMEAPAGYTDRLVELRNVHPAFVAAVQQMHQSRVVPVEPPPPAPLQPAST
jgi:hypothetical protein